MAIKKLIVRHPYLFGALIALVMFIAMIVMDTWFPSVGKAWLTHDTQVLAVVCTAALFVGFPYYSRELQRRGRAVFWVSVGIFFVLHILGVYFYSVYVHPMGTRRWMILLYLEGYGASYFVRWMTHRFGESSRDRHSDSPQVSDP